MCLLATLTLATTGCGDDGGDAAAGAGPTSTVAGLTPEERSRKLTEQAKGEQGPLRLYTSIEEEIAKELVEAFERDTGVQVDLFRAKSEQVLERILKEAKADVDGADVVETNGPGLVALSRAGALAPYPVADPGRLADGAGHEDWVTTRFNVFTVSRNTKAVPDAERPRSFEDLADPRWKGRLAMEADDFDWYLTLREHWMQREGLSEDEADARFEAIARNSRVVEGHPFIDELVAAGEFDVAVSNYSYSVELTAGKGAPVAWKPPVAPLVARPNGLAVVKQARRPAKAMLFGDWLLDRGQEVLVERGLDPVRRDLAEDPGVEVVRVDVEDVVDRQDEAVNGYRKILRNAGKGPEEEG